MDISHHHLLQVLHGKETRLGLCPKMVIDFAPERLIGITPQS